MNKFPFELYLAEVDELFQQRNLKLLISMDCEMP